MLYLRLGIFLLKVIQEPPDCLSLETSEKGAVSGSPGSSVLGLVWPSLPVFSSRCEQHRKHPHQKSRADLPFLGLFFAYSLQRDGFSSKERMPTALHGLLHAGAVASCL